MFLKLCLNHVAKNIHEGNMKIPKIQRITTVDEHTLLLTFKDWKRRIIIFLVLLLFSLSHAVDIYDSGGPLMQEQAAYDVTFYDLDLAVNPSDCTIAGSLSVEATILQPIQWFVLDLDTVLSISKVMLFSSREEHSEIGFQRQSGKVWIPLPRSWQPGERIKLAVFYGGRPHIATRPPWSGGFTWATTQGGAPWITTTCQGEGADIWWPCKDHVSDEPDSMALHIRVPDTLVVASNGKLLSVQNHRDGTHTFHWFVSNPINTYGVALNIAPYRTVSVTYTCVTGDTMPVTFWVLPEYYEQGVQFMAEIVKHLRFFEELLGPYPFRVDKYGVAQTPHLGMEHQTIIAYGAEFDNTKMTRGVDWGFDALHHHELSHEWWGNMVTCADWNDFWLHEGFGTYMQVLYLEKTQGMEKARGYLQSFRNFWNVYPVAPRESKSCNEMWNHGVYFKGAWILHTLRYLVGDDAFFKALRRMAYPTPETQQITDGRQTRFATTEQFREIVEKITGRELQWFFDAYLRSADLPELRAEKDEGRLRLSWHLSGNGPFPMSLDIRLGEKKERFIVPTEGLELAVKDDDWLVDPDNCVLCRRVSSPPAFVDPKILLSYAGEYRSETGARVTMSVRENQLFGSDRYYADQPLIAQADTSFTYRAAEYVEVVFHTDQNGKVIDLTRDEGSRKVRYTKSD
jgi:aminopeptidase N